MLAIVWLQRRLLYHETAGFAKRATGVFWAFGNEHTYTLIAGESYNMSCFGVRVVPQNEPVITLSATVNLNPPQNVLSDRPPVIMTVQSDAISLFLRLGSVSVKFPLVHLQSI